MYTFLFIHILTTMHTFTNCHKTTIYNTNGINLRDFTLSSSGENRGSSLRNVGPCCIRANHYRSQVRCRSVQITLTVTNTIKGELHQLYKSKSVYRSGGDLLHM